MTTLWDDLTEEQKIVMTRARKLAGHTSVAEFERLQRESMREQAFDEAIGWLKKAGYFEASAALEAVAFGG